MISSVLSDCQPLTFNESIFFAEQLVLIDVVVHQNMKAISTPLIGTIGPFVRDEIIQAPLSTVGFLADEGIAFPILPDWLEEDMIALIVQKEIESKYLQPCPDPYYIELGYVFRNSSYNPWAGSANPIKARETSLQLLEDLIALRRVKIMRMIEPFVKERGAISTDLSNLERRRLGLVGVEYLKKLEAISQQSENQRRTLEDDSPLHLEDLMHNLNFDMEDHFQLLEQAQHYCKELSEIRDGSQNTQEDT